MLSELTRNSSLILDINREISEIQRLVKVYGTTGGDAVLDKIKKSFKVLSKKLKKVDGKYISLENRVLISKLEEVLMGFGKNINELESLYKHKVNLINVRLPSTFDRGIDLIKKESLRKLTPFQKKYLQEIEIKWLQANLNALKYLKNKDYTYKKEFVKNLNDIRTILGNKELKNIDFSFFEKNKFELKQLFNQTIQANRIYLSLVNVVMAGSSIEFTKISNMLRKDILKKLEIVIKKSDQNFTKNKNETIIYLALTLLFLGFVSLYFHTQIASGIKEISSTFNMLIKGDLSKSIPGFNRADEIGQLAKAADTFKQYSIKLKEEKRKAKESEKIKTRFLATMSHEIRTPMNAILSCTNLLLSEENAPEVKEMLLTIKMSGDSLLILINDILDISKLESGKIKLEKSSFNLRKCMEGVVNLLETKAIKDNKKIQLNIMDEVPDYIIGDFTRLRQVLVNLVGNAIKFTEDKIEIKAEVLNKDQNEARLKFIVKDNGIGIPKKAIGNLFEDFTQVDASTTRKYGGTGLGLAISKGIVESMGGRIGVISEEGLGAEFFFTLKTEISKDQEVSQEQVDYKLDDSLQNSKIDILLAEDNSINQIVAKKILKKFGFVPDVASNGIEAVELIKKKNYDFILMDQHMPEMDGVEATIAIRKLNINQPIIYALTASAFAEDKERCLGAGMNGFLSKPIVVSELKEALSHVVQEKSKA